MSVYLTPKMQSQRISHTWMTKIQDNIQGVEKRSALFTWPRIKLESKLQLVDDEKRRFIYAHLFRDMHNIWSIPVISDETTLTVESASGQKIITVVDTGYRHFYDGRKCILVDPDDWETYEEVIIDTVDSGTQITASTNLINTWPIGTLIYPLYECRINPEQSRDLKFYTVNNISIFGDESFEAERTFTYTLPTIDTDIYPTYNSLSLFLTKPINPITEKYRHPYILLKNLGLQTAFTNYGNTRAVYDRTFLLITKKEIYDFLNFFDAQMGRLGTFYTPTWLQDIVVSVGFADTDVTLTTKELYLTSDEIVGRHIYIVLPDGTYVCREITGRPSPTSIIIDSGIGTTVATADLSNVTCSFLQNVRFNIDELAIDYITPLIAKIKLGFNTI